MSIQGELLLAVNRYIIQSFIGGLIIWLIYLFITTVLQKRKGKTISCYFAEFIFFVYLVAVLSITGVAELRISDFGGIGMTPNLIPIVFSVSDIAKNGVHVFLQMILNIILYLPFGLLSTFIFLPNQRKLFLRVLVSSIVFSCSLEMLQFFSGRYADIDDVILNVIGACLGYFIIYLFTKIKKKIFNYRE